jgi:uncharacterized protein HemX
MTAEPLGVGVMAFFASSGATVAQSAVQGTFGSSVVIPVALAVGIVSGLVAWAVWKGRVTEWQRQYENGRTEYRAHVREEFQEVRTEIRERVGALRRSVEQLDSKIERHGAEVRTMTDAFAGLRDDLRAAALQKRGRRRREDTGNGPSGRRVEQ